MRLLVPPAVFLLMVSAGMSLWPRDVVAQLRRTEWRHWAGLVLATFLIPAALALLLGRILPLQPAEMAGLFFVGAAPGTPLMTRNIDKRGFDMQLAAAYQVWGGLLTPIVLPLVVLVAGLLHELTIWIRHGWFCCRSRKTSLCRYCWDWRWRVFCPDSRPKRWCGLTESAMSC